MSLKSSLRVFLKIFLFLPYLGINICLLIARACKFLHLKYCRFREFIKNFKKFRHIFIFIAILSGIPLLVIFLTKKRPDYFTYYLYFVFIVFHLIKNVSEAADKQEGRISPWKFSYFVFRYLLFLLWYILLFGFVFWGIDTYNDGSFNIGGEYVIMTILDGIKISGFNFLTLDTGYTSQGLMSLAMFIEVFISNIFVLGFVFITFDKLLEKLKGKV